MATAAAPQIPLALRKAFKAAEDKKAAVEAELAKLIGHPIKITYDVTSVVNSAYTPEEKITQIQWYEDTATYNGASMWKAGVLQCFKKMCADEMTKETLAPLINEIHVSLAPPAPGHKWVIALKDGIFTYAYDKKRGGPPDAHEMEKELMKIL